MTGAGISTAAGIPDFRSPGTGLYDNLQKYDLPYPEAIFDISFFHENPEPFYALTKELYPGKFLPTKTHYFLTLLHHKQLLLRAFTQNIDTLERLAGVPDDILVEAHGSFASARCVKCKEMAANDMIPRCEHCKTGIVKPEITFFGESLPDRFFKCVRDFESADLLIVIGTSLKVQPFASLIDQVDMKTPRLLINREVAGVGFYPFQGFDFTSDRDAVWLGDCDEGVEELCELLGWRKELDVLYAAGHAELKKLWAEEKERAGAVAGKLDDQTAQEREESLVIERLAEDLERTVRLPKDAEESEAWEEKGEKEREERKKAEGQAGEERRKEETERKVMEAVREAQAQEVEIEVTTVIVEVKREEVEVKVETAVTENKTTTATEEVKPEVTEQEIKKDNVD
ncbi:SIR2 family histone deacetylase [Jimgerdemannia flammicorona]|uniref:NAD-dependent protein deacetylase n=1 Tax=Jimgerdemannia flammicorona TaxID=994334 RepID=A0A433Q4K3_9FUNG|nr:SIR2 family histone deacetylase [Jimgerdemannia flammicorona]